MNPGKVAVLLMMTAWIGAYAQQAALKGIETSDLNRTVQPCDNFYDFANGSWRAQNPIPSSMDRWSRRWQAGEQNKDQLRKILEELSSGPAQPKGTPAQLTGDFYAACTNVKAVDEVGAAPLKPYLAQIDAIKDLAGLQAELRELHALGIEVPFGFGSTQNAHSPNDVIAEVGASGLGLPDRDYYVKTEKRFVDARAGYLVYVAKIFTLAGAPESEAKADAQTVMEFETALAKVSLDNVALRDPHATDHIVTVDAVQKITPHFDWSAYLKSARVPAGLINVDQPDFMAEMERQLVSTPIAKWKIYLRWQFINASAMALSQPFVDAHFNFYQKELAGVGELKPRGTRCAEDADNLLGEALGQEYVKRYFPPEAKLRAVAMVTNILTSMRDTINDVDWMTPATKQKALEKISNFSVKIGYPDTWKDYSSVKIDRNDYFGNIEAATRFMVVDDSSLIGKPVDRKRWGMTPPTSNAYYNPQMNEIVFPAGILQPPAFSMNYSDAVNYGAIGVVIGHEISHGFDDQGSQYDATGNLANWWTPEDLTKFKAKTSCVVKQFDGFKIDGADDIHINGKLVLGESIGDLGGLKIAYRAFKKTAQSQSEEKPE
jgi:putative endopeptidase